METTATTGKNNLATPSNCSLFTITYSLRSQRSAPVGYAAEYLTVFESSLFDKSIV